jgi:hypothetical protein
MKAFIAKNKKILIAGAVLAVAALWWFKFRKPVPAPVIAPKSTPGTTMPPGVVAGQKAPVNQQPVVVSASTINKNQSQAQQLLVSYNRVVASITKGLPPNESQRAALDGMSKQLGSFGYKVVNGNLVTI